QAVIGFVPDRLADGALAHVAVKAAALDHEAGNHPVEDQANIVPGIGVAQEVLHGDGRRLGIQLDFDITMAGAQQDAGVVGQGSAGEQGEDAGSDDSFQHSGLRTEGCVRWCCSASVSTSAAGLNALSRQCQSDCEWLMSRSARMRAAGPRGLSLRAYR